MSLVLSSRHRRKASSSPLSAALVSSNFVAQVNCVRIDPDSSTYLAMQFFEQLERSDVPRLKQLLAVFGEAFGDRATYQGAVPTDTYLQSFLADERCLTVVAMDDDVLAGGLVAYELVKFEQERKEFYIYDLAVKEAHRRRGLATGLIMTLKAIARTRGAYVIYVQADHGDAAAIALYEKLGVREDVLHFDIDPEK
jgi:aminoglycoside 3-N-acetyltransferase I